MIAQLRLQVSVLVGQVELALLVVGLGDDDLEGRQRFAASIDPGPGEYLCDNANFGVPDRDDGKALGREGVHVALSESSTPASS
jgi:hypothetical protein